MTSSSRFTHKLRALPHWSYWLAGTLVAVLVLLGLLALFGPGIIKSQITQRGSELLKRSVRIEAVRLNPFTLEAEVRGLSIGTLDGKHEQLGLDRVWLNLTLLNLGSEQGAAELQVEQLRWQDDAGQPLVSLQALHVPVTQASLRQNRYAVGVVQVDGLRVQARRSAQGAINLLGAADELVSSLPRPAEPEAPAATPVQWSVRQVLLKDADIHFSDLQTPGKPGVVVSQDLHLNTLSLDGLNQTLAEPLSLALDAQINQAGTLSIQGPVQLKPFVSADLQLALQALPLKPAQPYIEDKLELILQDGKLDAAGKLHLALPPERPVQLKFSGSTALRDFASSDPLLKEPFLSWKALSVQDIDLSLGEPKAFVTLGKISFDDFFARLIVSPAGELNVLKIVRPRPQAGATAQQASNGKQAGSDGQADPVIRINEVAFNRGKVLFSDRFVKPSYTARIEQVGGYIRGLSSLRNELAEMAVSGRYNQISPVNVNARLNLLADQHFLDLAAKVRSIEMTSFNPYAGHYAGYNIEKGKLSLDLSYKLENQQLKAENHIFLDQLTFGDKVDSPTATSLPVRLAVALLKNRKGEIDINLPISGSLDDPQFSVGGIILQVIGNLIVKAVTAPFSLIASMFGSGDELSNVAFAAGTAELAPDAVKRLQTLAKALDDRPGLHLEITGRADPEADTAALKSAKTLKRAVGDDELRQLAQRRALAAQLWLVDSGGIPAERIFLLPGKVGNDAPASANQAGNQPSATAAPVPAATRVDFSLR